MGYCGKNGCFEVETGDHFNGEYLNIYLNSPVAYIYRGEESVRVIGGERPDPDITFELFADDSGDLLTGRMEVETLFSDGIGDFVTALMNHHEEIGDKDGLTRVVKDLLEQEGAAWGVIHPDPDELKVRPE